MYAAVPRSLLRDLSSAFLGLGLQITATGPPPTAPALDDTNIDTTAEDEITDSLIKGLEAPSDDDDSSNEVEVSAPNAGGWPALQYATYMTGTLQFVKEKHRAQGYLAAELARARNEFGDEGGDGGPKKRPTLEVCGDPVFVSEVLMQMSL